MEVFYNKYRLASNFLKKAYEQSVEVTKKNGVVFVGDSLIEMYDLEHHFPGMEYINRGISGDATLSLLQTIDFRVIDLKPKKVFIMIGTNDLGRRLNLSIPLHNMEILLSYIVYSLPTSKIYLCSIPPANHDYSNPAVNVLAVSARATTKIKKMNEQIAKIASKLQVEIIDTFTPFADQEGELVGKYTTDGLHFSQEGYNVLTTVLKKYL